MDHTHRATTEKRSSRERPRTNPPNPGKAWPQGIRIRTHPSFALLSLPLFPSNHHHLSRTTSDWSEPTPGADELRTHDHDHPRRSPLTDLHRARASTFGEEAHATTTTTTGNRRARIKHHGSYQGEFSRIIHHNTTNFDAGASGGEEAVDGHATSQHYIIFASHHIFLIHHASSPCLCRLSIPILLQPFLRRRHRT